LIYKTSADEAACPPQTVFIWGNFHHMRERERERERGGGDQCLGATDEFRSMPLFQIPAL